MINCHMTIPKSSAERWCCGMTLPGTMVALGVSSILLAVLAAFSFYSGRSMAAMGNYVDLDNTSRRAVDVMTREIRQTGALIENPTNVLTFTNYESHTALQYIYDPINRNLTQVKDGTSTVLLTECDSLQFHLYQRTPQVGTNVFFPTTNPALVKLIDMNWRCSRNIFGRTNSGDKANTETVQTAQVVLRNEPPK